MEVLFLNGMPACGLYALAAGNNHGKTFVAYFLKEKLLHLLMKSGEGIDGADMCGIGSESATDVFEFAGTLRILSCRW